MNEARLLYWSSTVLAAALLSAGIVAVVREIDRMTALQLFLAIGALMLLVLAHGRYWVLDRRLRPADGGGRESSGMRNALGLMSISYLFAIALGFALVRTLT
ncbi:MAG: hypothetical protein FJW35_04070 [Acidobacteria bacterium]|nr:hypothetical protein [Acidobacteriota bacterium]